MQRYIMLLALLFVYLLIGCGSGDRSVQSASEGSKTSATGRASFTIAWPERSRLISAASNSISIALKNGAQTIATQTVTRPQFNTPTTSTADFPSVPPGDYTAKLTAYPNANGTGVAQSGATVPVKVVAGQTATVPVTLASTIVSLTLSPLTPSLTIGQNLPFTMTAKDAANRAVLTAASKVQWSSSDTNVATVEPATGNSSTITGVHAGTAQIQVTDTESGKTAMTTVTVVNPARPIYIADTNNHRIVRIDDMSGANPVTFGTRGSGNGQFEQPSGIAVDANNRIYVVDSGNHHVVRMDNMSGANFTVFGTQGSGTGQFSGPMGICIDGNDHIYVADTQNNRIVRFDDVNGQITNWAATTAAQELNQPSSVFVGSNNKIVIADTHNYRIVQLDDMNGANQQAFGEYGTGPGYLLFPQGVYVQGGHIFVTDAGDRIIRVDDMQGHGWTEFNQSGSGVRQVTSPTGIFVDTDAKIYVADSGNSRIIRMDDMTGANWTSYAGSSAFLYPRGICIR